MTSRAITTAYDCRPLVTDCQLAHHRPESRVGFNYRGSLYTGRVVSHDDSRRRITIAVDPDGHHYSTECGCVGKGEK